MTDRYEIDDLAYDDVDWKRYYEQEDADYADWLDWWEALSDDDRAHEQQKMDAYVEECRIERERLGHDV